MVHTLEPAQELSGRAPGFVKHPDYDLKLRPTSSLHQVIFGEAVVAASDRVIIVHEQGLYPVVYFPRVDVDMSVLGKEEETTYCPFKGTASHWSIEVNGKSDGKAAWTYELPFEEVAALRNHIAFYMDKMDCHWRNGMELPLVGPGRCEKSDCHERCAA